MSINSVELLGNVVRDPVVKTTQRGTLYAYFTVATSKNLVSQDTGEVKEIASFVPIVAWRKQAETVQTFLRKGTRVFVHGEIASRSYDQNGQRRYVTEVTADLIAPQHGGEDRHGN